MNARKLQAIPTKRIRDYVGNLKQPGEVLSGVAYNAEQALDAVNRAVVELDDLLSWAIEPRDVAELQSHLRDARSFLKFALEDATKLTGEPKS